MFQWPNYFNKIHSQENCPSKNTAVAQWKIKEQKYIIVLVVRKKL